MNDKTECYCDGDYICTQCEAPEEPTEGEKETNRLLHYITGGDFL
jgi:hypothetical protein